MNASSGSGLWPTVMSCVVMIGGNSELSFRPPEDVGVLQRQLEGVRHARHVMAAAAPPDHVERPFGAIVFDEFLVVRVRDRGGRLRLLAGERERRPLRRAER